jgi:hypothetical protein
MKILKKNKGEASDGTFGIAEARVAAVRATSLSDRQICVRVDCCESQSEFRIQPFED